MKKLLNAQKINLNFYNTTKIFYRLKNLLMYNESNMNNEEIKNGKLFVISGSSGVGKGTLLKELLAKRPELKLSVSATTRNPRPGEEEGINYFFLTREQFEEDVKNGEFLEWAEFNGNCYGTKEPYVRRTLAKGKHLILEIETQGALQIKQKLPDAILIFILPPSLEELEPKLLDNLISWIDNGGNTTIKEFKE